MNPLKERSAGRVVVIRSAACDRPDAGMIAAAGAAGFAIEVLTAEEFNAGLSPERKPVAVLFDGTAIGDPEAACWERLTGPFALCRPAVLLFAGRDNLPALDGARVSEADQLIVLPAGAGEVEFRLRAAVRERARRLEGETRMHVLSQEHDEARRAAAAKAEFLARMSHELRTPLNGIISAAELLGETRLVHDQVPLVETLKSSGEQLLALINNVLDYSKIESGRMEIDSRPFDPARCALRVVDMVATRIAGKQVELLAVYPPDLPVSVMGDPLRLQQVLLNLVGNSVKFTSSGEILLRVTPVEFQPGSAEVRLRFEVSDTGAGIPRDVQARLFNAFEQGGAGVARQFGGSGLGLSIARNLVALMGGNLQFESTPGEGTRFHFTLRLPVRCTTGAAAAAALRGRHLLLLETHAATAAMIEAHARAWGMAVTRASSPEAAFAGGRGDGAFDAMIADDDVTDSVVAGVLESARVRDAASRPALILLSRLHSKRRHESPLHERAVVMLKPVKADELRRQLEDMLAAPADVAAGEEAAAPPAPRAALSSVKVLLVDDNEINLSVGQRMLRRVGVEPDLAVNGEEAVRAVQRGGYDLVFMDVQMPVMNGLDATRAIRAVQEFAVRPVIIAMTANSLAGDREVCLAAGMQDYLAKPMRPEEVEMKLLAWAPKLTRQPANTDRASDEAQAAAAPLAPVEDGPPVDMQRLEYFSAGDAGALRDIVGLYFQQAEKQLAELFEGVERGEAGRVRAVAHTCAGASATCGMNGILGPLRELERMGRASELAGADGCLRQARGALDRARAFLKSEGCL